MYTKEILNNYKKPKPYIKVLQILQLQCLHFVVLRCFLKTVKETEVFTSMGNFDRLFTHCLLSSMLTHPRYSPSLFWNRIRFACPWLRISKNVSAAVLPTRKRFWRSSGIPSENRSDGGIQPVKHRSQRVHRNSAGSSILYRRNSVGRFW